MILLGILLDMVVIPHVVQSDNEFDTLVLNEMLSLLGSLQFFG